jgi:tRNA splicing endonuclease
MAAKSVVIEDSDLVKKLFRVGAIPEIVETVELHPLIAELMAEKGVLKSGKYLAMLKTDKLAKDTLEVIRHLWSKGYVCRLSLEGEDYIRVHRKGIRPGEDRTQYLVAVVPKNWKTSLTDLQTHIEFAGKLRKELVFAYVDSGRVQFVGLSRRTFE